MCVVSASVALGASAGRKESETYYCSTLIFIGYLLASVTFVVVVCGNSDEQIINIQTKIKKLVSLQKRGIKMYFCTEPLITTTLAN